MLGLEKVYFDLDCVRKRLIRLVEMERLPDRHGLPLIDGVLALMVKVNGLIPEEEEDVPGEERARILGS